MKKIIFVILFLWLSSASANNDEIKNRINELRYWAEKGDAKSQLDLGVLYLEGSVIKQDDKIGASWIIKSALQGNIAAQFALGSLYDFGIGVLKNDKESIKWYRISAEKGYSYAQFSLGNAYYRGDGVLEDYKTAFKWFKKPRNKVIQILNTF